MWVVRGICVPSGSVEYLNALILRFLDGCWGPSGQGLWSILGALQRRARLVAADELGTEQIDGLPLLCRLGGCEVPEALDVLP
jgi:hypothetical protein